jgi:hypothetical protein
MFTLNRWQPAISWCYKPGIAFSLSTKVKDITFIARRWVIAYVAITLAHGIMGDWFL